MSTSDVLHVPPYSTNFRSFRKKKKATLFPLMFIIQNTVRGAEMSRYFTSILD